VTAKGRPYRAAAWPRVLVWLRAHGVRQEMAFHALRKEVGSILAQQHGIYAASKFLRHSSVNVTQAVYVEPRGEEAPTFEIRPRFQQAG
jgi:integrase